MDPPSTRQGRRAQAGSPQQEDHLALAAGTPGGAKAATPAPSGARAAFGERTNNQVRS